MKKPASVKGAMAAVRKGLPLGIVPEEMRTPEVCLAAVQCNGHALEFVPERLLEPEICAEAVKNFPAVYFFLPDERREALQKALEGRLPFRQARKSPAAERTAGPTENQRDTTYYGTHAMPWENPYGDP